MDREINQDNLEKLINVGDNISFADLFNPEFMAEYTDFKTIQDLFKKSTYHIETEDDFKEIPDDEWEAFIIANTSFDSWKAMQIKAFDVYTDNILLS